MEIIPTGVINAVKSYYNIFITRNKRNCQILDSYNINKGWVETELLYMLQDKLEKEWDVALNDQNVETCIQNIFDNYELGHLKFYIKRTDIIILPERVTDNFKLSEETY